MNKPRKVFVVDFTALFPSVTNAKDLELLRETVAEVEAVLNNAGAEVVLKDVRWHPA